MAETTVSHTAHYTQQGTKQTTDQTADNRQQTRQQTELDGRLLQNPVKYYVIPIIPTHVPHR